MDQPELTPGADSRADSRSSSERTSAVKRGTVLVKERNRSPEIADFRAAFDAAIALAEADPAATSAAGNPGAEVVRLSR